MLLAGLWLWARRILWFKMDLIRWWWWHFSVLFFEIIYAIWWIFIRLVDRTHTNYRWAMKKITWLKEFPKTSTLSWTSSLVMVGFVISSGNGTSSFQLQSQWNEEVALCWKNTLEKSIFGPKHPNFNETQLKLARDLTRPKNAKK